MPLVLLLLLGVASPAVATAPAAKLDLEKGIIYVQPSYHFASTLQLDLEVLRRDLDTIAEQVRGMVRRRCCRR